MPEPLAGTNGSLFGGEHTNMTSHIKLYGSKSDRFEEIKAKMEQQLGYEPSNPEVVGLIMAAYETDETSALRVDNAAR